MKYIVFLFCFVALPASLYAQSQSARGSVLSARPISPTEKKLAQLGKAEAVALSEAVLDPEPDVRQAAIFAIQAMGPLAKPAIPALTIRLRDPDHVIRVDAAHALAGLSPESLPSLTEALSDPDPEIRELAARTLMQMNPPPTDSVPALVATMSDPETRVRQAAVLALQMMGPSAKLAIPTAAEMLHDPDSFVRIDASHLLIAQGSSAVPNVMRMLRDPNPDTRQIAAWTLRAISVAIVSGSEEKSR